MLDFFADDAHMHFFADADMHRNSDEDIGDWILKLI